MRASLRAPQRLVGSVLLLLATVSTGLRPKPPYRLWAFAYNSTAPVDCFEDGNGHQTCSNKTISTAVSTVSSPPAPRRHRPLSPHPPSHLSLRG